MASSSISPSELSGPPLIKIIEDNIDIVRNLVDEKPNYSISLPTPTPTSFQS